MWIVLCYHGRQYGRKLEESKGEKSRDFACTGVFRSVIL